MHILESLVITNAWSNLVRLNCLSAFLINCLNIFLEFSLLLLLYNFLFVFSAEMRNTSPLSSPKTHSGDDWSGNDGSATSSR